MPARGPVQPPLLVEDREGVDRIEVDALAGHALPLDGHVVAAAPLRPGSVVDGDVRAADEIEPQGEDARRHPRAARRHDGPVEVHAGRLEDLAEVVRAGAASRPAGRAGRTAGSGSRECARRAGPGAARARSPRSGPPIARRRPASSRVSRFRRTPSRSVTSSGRRRAVKWRRAGLGSPVSMGRPSSRQRGKPPSRTATRSCPNTRNVHQTRAEADRYFPAYTTTRSPSPTPRAPTASAKVAAIGQHVRQALMPVGDRVDVEVRRRRGRAPARNSARASRLEVRQVPASRRATRRADRPDGRRATPCSRAGRSSCPSWSLVSGLDRHGSIMARGGRRGPAPARPDRQPRPAGAEQALRKSGGPARRPRRG